MPVGVRKRPRPAGAAVAAMLRALRKARVGRQRMNVEATEARTAISAAAFKPVAFACSHAGCLVGVTVEDVDIVFIGTGGTNLPVGEHDLFYRVKGPARAKFTITATGAEMDPIVDALDGQGVAFGATAIVVKE